MANSNGKVWKIITVAITVISLGIGIVYGYGKLNGRFEAVEKEIPKINNNENAIIGMEKDIGYIKQAVIRIEKKL